MHDLAVAGRPLLAWAVAASRPGIVSDPSPTWPSRIIASRRCSMKHLPGEYRQRYWSKRRGGFPAGKRGAAISLDPEPGATAAIGKTPSPPAPLDGPRP